MDQLNRFALSRLRVGQFRPQRCGARLGAVRAGAFFVESLLGAVSPLVGALKLFAQRVTRISITASMFGGSFT